MKTLNDTDRTMDQQLTDWVNNLSSDEMARLHNAIDGPIPQRIINLTDDELLTELFA